MIRSKSFALAVPSVLLVLALAGCDDGDPGTTPDAGGGGEVDSGGGGDVDAGGRTDSGRPVDEDAGPIGDVTYYGDVRPILAENCVGCHVTGGIAPFPLDTYDAAAPLATRLMEVTRDRIMPPFLADNGGACQTYDQARWLSAREIALIAAWDEQGEPMGDPSTPDPIVPPLPTLTGSVTTIATTPYTPSGGSDDYRCFVVDAVSATNTFLTGYQVNPGQRAIVHHVIVYAPTSASEGDQARARDAAEAGPGYTCFGAPGVGAYPVVLWAPGGGATLFPEGTGVELTGGIPLVIQVHYNLLAGGGEDRTTVDLQLQSAPRPTRARIVPLGDFDMRIAPRMASVSTSHTEDLGALTRGFDLPLTVYGVFPHMHTLGRQLRVDHIAARGGEQCMVDVPRWDFNWQLAYFYETPVTISSLDSLRITCTYDTTSRTEVVTWGEGTQDEMCLNYFYVVVASGL